MLYLLFFLIPFASWADIPRVKVGIDNLFTEEHTSILKGKKIGLITNHTAVNGKMESTSGLLKKNAHAYNYTLKALFAPEHGITGASYASEAIDDEKDPDGIPIYSLHGKTKRPTEKMLKNLDLLIYDIQDIGSRSYTYVTTLFYAMEEAAKRGIPVMILDRPNPINGVVVDGPMLEEKWRSMVGYVNVPYCHGMTVGELASFFNEEYKIGCELYVVPMKGWRRMMSFNDTGLAWIPTSPNIPEATTPLYYPATGLIGELQFMNIGIGYTLPFKVVGAPWVEAKKFAEKLNAQKFPGVYFEPFYYRPFFGRFAQEDCQGVLIIVTNPRIYQPVSTQYLLIGMLKGLYPAQFKEALDEFKPRKEMFCKVNGTEEVYRLIAQEKNIVWKLRSVHGREREEFKKLRKKYLIPDYSED